MQATTARLVGGRQIRGDGYGRLLPCEQRLDQPPQLAHVARSVVRIIAASAIATGPSRARMKDQSRFRRSARAGKYLEAQARRLHGVAGDLTVDGDPERGHSRELLAPGESESALGRFEEVPKDAAVCARGGGRGRAWSGLRGSCRSRRPSVRQAEQTLLRLKSDSNGRSSTLSASKPHIAERSQEQLAQGRQFSIPLPSGLRPANAYPNHVRTWCAEGPSHPKTA